ncbi:MAG: GHKL domain-containing protein [Acidobacteriota bacterium]|nr:GHKL domain-containing protein [Acidobacteriota bacterium]
MWSRTSLRATGPPGRSAPVDQQVDEDGPAGPGADARDQLVGRLMAALEGIGEAIVVSDDAGQTVFENQAASDLLGEEGASAALAAQAVSEALRDALSGARRERRLDLISPLRRSLSIRSFPTGEGSIDGAVAVIEDISERVRLEAVRRDFVANVSHELKTPTGALTLLAETIDGESDPDVVGRLVRRMGGEAERLSRIIDDLLDLSRIEANETPSGALVPVRDFVLDAVQSLQAVASGLDVDVEVLPIPAGSAVPGDRRDLVSAVANLVDNAIKYSEAGGTVTVAVEMEGRHVAVKVSDRGVGIPSRDLERIFERFYRVDRARSRATGGTGLGLSIVRHVAANHGGRVSVTSVEGEGSTFVLELPAVRLPEGSDGEGGRDDDHD